MLAMESSRSSRRETSVVFSSNMLYELFNPLMKRSDTMREVEGDEG
jgi:hypothetical protein